MKSGNPRKGGLAVGLSAGGCRVGKPVFAEGGVNFANVPGVCEVAERSEPHTPFKWVR